MTVSLGTLMKGIRILQVCYSIFLNIKRPPLFLVSCFPQFGQQIYNIG
jgi:hypothetical protein